MASNPDDGFYVGYRSAAPPATTRFVRPRVLGLLGLVLALACILVLAQKPFSTATFEFGTVRDFEGWIEADPYPVLALDPPGRPTDVPVSRYLLVAFGKHGANDLVDGFEGRRVRLRGTLVHHDGTTMIEVEEGSVADSEDARPPARTTTSLGTATLVGEIVDSKCFLGVMKPGNTKPHRACATRCISGGVPPVLLVRDDRGAASYYLLTAADGRAVNRAVLDLVAEPVSITGEVESQGDLLILRADPETYQRLE